MAAALVVVLLVALPGFARGGLTAEEIELKVSIETRGDEMTTRVAEWVDVNTGSYNLAGLKAFAALLRVPLEELGFEIEELRGKPIDVPGHGELHTGPTLVARRLREGRPRLLLVGHYDTVFEPGSSFTRFELLPQEAGRARGPGVADMKGGLVVLFSALRGLMESGDLDRGSFTVILNGDEEIGSLGSRAVIEEAARKADYGLVFEASYGSSMVRSRRGLGQFHLQVDGVAAHAGNAHDRGRSAVRELAHKIVAVEGLTDYERGVTLNVGTVSGGTKRNIVPEHAEAWIDVRYDAPESGEWVRDRLGEIADQTYVEGTRTELWGTLHRPPKLETPAVSELLDRHAGVVQDLGLAAPERVHSGGGTDGSLMGGVGLPTLDSMGAIGGNAHTEQEYIVIDSLPERSAIAALLMRRLMEAPATASGE